MFLVSPDLFSFRLSVSRSSLFEFAYSLSFAWTYFLIFTSACSVPVCLSLLLFLQPFRTNVINGILKVFYCCIHVAWILFISGWLVRPFLFYQARLMLNKLQMNQQGEEQEHPRIHRRPLRCVASSGHKRQEVQRGVCTCWAAGRIGDQMCDEVLR